MAQLAGFICVVGWFTVIVIVFKVANLIGIYVLPSRLSHYAHVASNGDSPWALVTGASDGIGKAFIQELASHGFNVVLHGRNHGKLSLVMKELQKRHPERDFKVLVADASRVGCMNCIQKSEHQHQLNTSTNSTLPDNITAIDFKAIRASLEDLHLTVLINNAGGGPRKPVFTKLIESSEARTADNISLNALFPFHMMRELLPILNRNGPSLIMNISSMADRGFPLLASYSASKQFLMNATRAVGLEMRLDDSVEQVEVLGIRIGRVTGVSGHKEQSSLFTPNSEAMARAALSRAGYGHGTVIGYWSHALQGVSVGILPTWLGNKVLMIVMRKQRDTELAEKSD